MILRMVETWEELAVGREKMLKSREKAKATEITTLEEISGTEGQDLK
jgi:hypothetical protein